MQVVKNFTFKELSTTEPGELLQLTIGREAALAIVIRKDMQTFLLGVLASAIADRPFVKEIRGVNHTCVSYGFQWVLEPFVGPETRAKNRAFVEIPGSLYLYGDTPILHFGPAPGEQAHGGYTCDLLTLEYGDVPQAAMPFAKWKIWPSAGEITETGEGALFENLTTLPQG